jgi:hypothetical protein
MKAAIAAATLTFSAILLFVFAVPAESIPTFF